MKDVVNTLTFGTIMPDMLDRVWPDVEKLLDKSVAVVDGKVDVDDVREQIRHGGMVLWLVVDDTTPIAALTTRVIAYPRRSALALDWVGGSRMNEWLGLVMPTLKQYAVANGCLHLEGYGRKAWGRALAKYGWGQEYIAYRMEILDE